MTEADQSIGDDDFPTEKADIHAVAEIAATLAETLPANAIRYFMDQTNPQTQPDQHAILSRITTVEVVEFLEEEDIPHLQTFLRFEVSRILGSRRDITAIQSRYEICNQETSGDKNPLVPYVTNYIKKLTPQ